MHDFGRYASPWIGHIRDMPMHKAPESVWDYPRPPRVEAVHRRVRIVLFERTIVDTMDAYRVLETSHPPTIYVARSAVAAEIAAGERTSFCEWKGQASYIDVRVGERVARDVAWTYPMPSALYTALAGALAFYPSRVDACFLDDERARAQPGDFYGGWITDDLAGPFKGGLGTRGW
ncbi:MAG: DUF427 domain-containing protein [Candidatus Velthaea sp.]